MIVDMLQGELLVYALLAFAAGHAASPDGGPRLAEGEVEARKEGRLDGPAVRGQDLLASGQWAEHDPVPHTAATAPPPGLAHVRLEQPGRWPPARLGRWAWARAARWLDPGAIGRQPGRRLRCEAVGQAQRQAARRQHRDDLVAQALRPGQRPGAAVAGQQPRGAGGESRPDPLGRACQAREGLRLAARASLPRAEPRTEGVQLALRNADSGQAIVGKGRGVVRQVAQPLQHGVGGHLEPPGHSAEAQACRQGTQRPHAEGRCAALAMPRRAVGRLKRAPAAGALQRSPWSAVGLPLGPARAQPYPAAIATGRIGTAMA